jgi:hypothetical protein
LTTLVRLSKVYSSTLLAREDRRTLLENERMLTPRSTLTRRVMAVLDATPSRIPVILGGCGTGRTILLHQLRDRIGRTSAQYLDVERTATTPERFLRAAAAASPFPSSGAVAAGARAAFDATLAFFARAHTGGGEAATFLLDEFLELRTFESFPGLRRTLHELLDGLASSGNRFVLTSRYSARVLRVIGDRTARFEVIHMPPLSPEDTADMLAQSGAHRSAGDPHDREHVARTVHALADGRAVSVHAIVDELAAMQEHGGGDPVSALTALMAPGGRLAHLCHLSYELRLHRARGYGALKAILDILAEEEGLTLTEISHRLQRTPGSTKDYLSWLEDVDLVTARQKRYSFVDPLLRTWVRLHCRPSRPTEEDVVREIHRYAIPRVPQAEPVLAMATAGSGPAEEEKKGWGIIEID